MSDMSTSNKVLFGNPEEDKSKIIDMDQAELDEEIDDVVSIEEGKKQRKKKSSAQSLI